ncbi:MAG: hypothetical protein Marn2KO_36050 [Marinobacter nauticus]
MLQQYGWADRYDVHIPHGRNSRMDEIQAAILRIKLTHLDEWNDARRKILSRYRSELPDTIQLCAHSGADGVGHLAVIAVQDRQAAQTLLQEANIATGVHFPILDCDQTAMKDKPHKSAPLPVSRAYKDRILTLPCFPGMRETEIQTVCSVLSRLETEGP